MATNVFYSIGQNTDDHKTGSPNITISSGVATFTVSQTATNMGVGDRIIHAGGDGHSFIASKTSNTVWNVINATGGNPTDVTSQSVTSIAHEFTTIAAAESGMTDSNHMNTTNLVSGDFVANLPCYFDTGSETNLNATVGGLTTDATRFVKIYTPFNTSTECNQSQRHTGKWTSTAYNLSVVSIGSSSFGLEPTSNGTLIEGLQIKMTSGGVHTGVAGLRFNNQTTNRKITVKQCICVSDSASGGNAFSVFGSDVDCDKVIKNCIMYAINNIQQDVVKLASNDNMTLFQCTISNTSSVGLQISGSGTFIIKNCAIFNCLSDINDATAGASVTIDFVASDGGHGTNAVDISPGPTEADDWDDAFVDYINNDFHIKNASSVLVDAGTDLTADGVTEDIDGDTRPQGTAFDIGADELLVDIGDSLFNDGFQRGFDRGLGFGS